MTAQYTSWRIYKVDTIEAVILKYDFSIETHLFMKRQFCYNRMMLILIDSTILICWCTVNCLPYICCEQRGKYEARGKSLV